MVQKQLTDITIGWVISPLRDITEVTCDVQASQQVLQTCFLGLAAR